MAAFIQNISTAVPEQSYDQDFLRERMKEYISDDKMTQRIIHRIYSKSGIDKRHTVIRDFHSNGDPRFFFQEDGSLNSPPRVSVTSSMPKKQKSYSLKRLNKLLTKTTRLLKVISPM